MTEKTITTTEARKNISNIIKEVESGDTVYVITRNDRVVAKLISEGFWDKNKISPDLDNEIKEVFKEYGVALKDLADR